jgi:hypothetical protein
MRGGAFTGMSEIQYLLCQKHRRFFRHKMTAFFGNDTLKRPCEYTGVRIIDTVDDEMRPPPF